MSTSHPAPDEFRAAYRTLLEEFVRLTEADLESSAEWASSLLESPLVFPPQLEDLPRFAALKARFLELTSGAQDDIGERETIAREEIVDVAFPRARNGNAGKQAESKMSNGSAGEEALLSDPTPTRSLRSARPKPPASAPVDLGGLLAGGRPPVTVAKPLVHEMDV